MDRAKRSRKPLRASLTKTIKEATQELAQQEPDETKLRCSLKKLEEVTEQVAELDQKVLDALLDQEVDEAVYDTECTNIEEYRDAVRLAVQQVKDFLAKRERSVSPTPSSASGIPSTPRMKNYKLPKIKIREFNGELVEWLGWWAQFKKIDEDKELAQSDKFQYLVQSLVPGSRAKELVDSYPQSEENYPKVVGALKERFGKPKLLKQVYVRELLKMVIHTAKTKEKISLSKMFDKLESHLRSLESLGVTIDQSAEFLFPLVESSLPEDVLIAWQRSTYYGQDGSKLDPPKSELDFLLEFLKREVESEDQRHLSRSGFTAAPADKPKQKKFEFKRSQHEDDVATASGLLSGVTISRIFCDKGHPSQECIKAQSMTWDDKMDKVKKTRSCFICFKKNHTAAQCKAVVRCPMCSKKHFPLMCPKSPQNWKADQERKEENKQANQEKKTNPVQSGLSSLQQGQVLLESLLVTVVGTKSQSTVRLLFDNGSQRSSILKSVAINSGCKYVNEEKICRSLYGGHVTQAATHRNYEVKLMNPRGGKICTFSMLDEDNICGEIQRIPNGTWMQELKQHHIWVTDTLKNNTEATEISILIGSDYYQSLMTGRRVSLSCGLVAVETLFGWTLSGQIPRNESLASAVTSMLSVSWSPAELWSLEAIGIRDPGEAKTQAQKDQDAKEHFLNTVSRKEDGRYSVKLPWVNENMCLPSNRSVAEKRLISMTKKLEDLGQYENYDKIFKMWEEEVIVESVNTDSEAEDTKNRTHYLPHRAVFKPSSATTPIRPVFDASCRMGRNPSLNDCLVKGPNLLELIPDLLLRFREKRVGVIADIRKAFLMVGVDKEDRDFLRFLWWDEQKQIKVYRHARVVFGVTSSPFLLAAVIEHHLDNVQDDDNKEITDKMRKSNYVDNCVTSVDTLEDYKTFKDESTKIMSEAKMDLREWEHSDMNGLHSRIGSLSSRECGLELNVTIPAVKVLGLEWDKQNDCLFCDVDKIELEKRTKRSILSQVQRVFDPLGFLSPAMIVPKLIIQEMWKQKTAWDDDLDPETAKRYLRWYKSIEKLSEIKIARHIGMEPGVDQELHTFCDASAHAYAAVIFLKTRKDDQVKISLIASKARVAPLKELTIPRLELMAACIGARLTDNVKRALSLEVPTKYWSDSSTTLAWIKRNCEWGTFVGNRVKQICELSNSDDWQFVPGHKNPADLPSRGCNPDQLLESKWWEGPSWLLHDKCDWTTDGEDEELIQQEVRKKTVKLLTLTGTPWYVFKFSSYNMCIRTMGWIMRFIKRCKKVYTYSSELTIDEVNEGEKTLVKLIQGEQFDTNAKSINGIRTVQGEDGLLHVASKLLHRQDSQDFRLPIILPSKHEMVTRLICEQHQKHKHAGVQFLMSKLRERFWILKGRKYIKKIIGNCVICKRYSSKAMVAPTAALPENRVKNCAVFEVTGIDLAGPLYLKDKSKCWLVLFTCAVYRAVHLELVTALSTDMFLLAFFRFISRRGHPCIVYTDNGTNFVGTNNLFNQLDWKRIERDTCQQRIKWIFNPPSAAWWGGWWERLIRTVKDLLKRMLGHSKLNYVQLETCLCEVESIINSRPLTYVTEDSEDLIPLTPSMFLQDLRDNHYAEAEVLDSTGLQQKYKRLQHLRQELRDRFRSEYLGQLVQRGCQRKEDSFKIGDVVLISSDNKKRIEWPLAKIIELFPGHDGIVRTVKLKTATGDLVRPIQRLYHLEVANEEARELGTPKHPLETKKPTWTEDIITRSGRHVKKPLRFICED